MIVTMYFSVLMMYFNPHASDFCCSFYNALDPSSKSRSAKDKVSSKIRGKKDVKNGVP